VSTDGVSLTEEGRGRIVKLWQSGRDVGEIADIMDINPKTAALWVERHQSGEGLKDRPKPPPTRPPRQTKAEKEDRVCALRQDGLSTNEIAEKTGLHYQTVTRILKRRGMWLAQS